MAPGWMSRIFKSLLCDDTPSPSIQDQEVGAGQEREGGDHAPRICIPERPELTAVLSRRIEPEAGSTSVLDGGTPGAEPLHVTWHGATDRGRARPQNEDSYSCVTSKGWSLFVVADGMGGHDAGEVASRIAAETVCREIEEGMKHPGGSLPGLVEHAVQQANSRVNQEGASKGSNMGTTLSLALLTGGTGYIASVGDSRVYCWENGSLSQITQDHSLVASLVKTGELTKEGARNHPRANILFRTVGRPEQIAVDTFQVALKKGGIMMLCTDGLWGEVSDEDICQVLAAREGARAACEKLVMMANEHGGRDNITAVVVVIS